MMLHSYSPCPVNNFLHLTVSEIQAGQTFPAAPPDRPLAHLATMVENNTPTALHGCGVKTIYRIWVIYLHRLAQFNARLLLCF